MPWVTIKLDLQAPLPRPEGANFFHFTQVLDEVEMLVGYLPLTKLHNASEAAEHNAGELMADDQMAIVSPEITHRLSLTMNGFRTLKERVDLLAERIEARIREEGSGGAS